MLLPKLEVPELALVELVLVPAVSVLVPELAVLEPEDDPPEPEEELVLPPT
jgi:hypothetical protein